MNKAQTLLAQAMSALEQKNFLLAVEGFDSLLKTFGHVSAIHYNRGLALRGLMRFEEAISSFNLAISCDAANVDAYNESGNSRYGLGRIQDALRTFDQALLIQPDHVPARKNRVAILQKLQEHERAIADFEYLLGRGYCDANILYGLGAALSRLGRYSKAITYFEKGRQEYPNHPFDILEETYCRLMVGDFATGWQLHERRWERRPFDYSHLQRYWPLYAEGRPLWLGDESLSGKTILLWLEQGFGDTLQFCRYADLVQRQGASVLMVAHASLLRLFDISFSRIGIQVVQADEIGSIKFDFHAPLMSLPLACKTNDLSKIPAYRPYIFAAQNDIQAWRTRLGTFGGLRVGLVWAGGYRPDQSEQHQVDAIRSLKLEQFAPVVKLGDTANLQFFSLQKGIPAAQLSSDHGVVDWTDELFDWADTAALIANLDLVISVDTAVAHLAGAMGKPVWLLSRFNGCWRWLEDRTDSPWYPTMRIFRQPKVGDWDSVIDQVELALQELVSHTTGKI
jgi:tetratricopeptide (TPR) repeat protein